MVALKFKGADKIALITDALRPAGTNATESYLGEKNPKNKIIIEEGVAKLPDRSVYTELSFGSAMLAEVVVAFSLT